ncbi:MAG: glucuronate isomerase, partial [Pyrinomonadaceae bacterium]
MNNVVAKQLDNRFKTDGDGTANANDVRELRKQVDEIISTVPAVDLHTHLFAPQFGNLSLSGIDELLNYHYLIAELFRYSRTTPAEFWRMEKRNQADLIWKTLFVENTPLSEATRGVVSVLSALGLDSRASDLTEARDFFASHEPDSYLEKVLRISKVSDIVMTNDPLDDAEAKVWNGCEKSDPRFHAALRLDRILNNWLESVPLIRQQDYEVAENIDGRSISEIRRFLDYWIEKMKPLYMGVSLPDNFTYPEESERGKLIREAVLPSCRAHGIS